MTKQKKPSSHVNFFNALSFCIWMDLNITLVASIINPAVLIQSHNQSRAYKHDFFIMSICLLKELYKKYEHIKFFGKNHFDSRIKHIKVINFECLVFQKPLKTYIWKCMWWTYIGHLRNRIKPFCASIIWKFKNTLTWAQKSSGR